MKGKSGKHRQGFQEKHCHFQQLTGGGRAGDDPFLSEGGSLNGCPGLKKSQFRAHHPHLIIIFCTQTPRNRGHRALLKSLSGPIIQKDSPKNRCLQTPLKGKFHPRKIPVFLQSGRELEDLARRWTSLRPDRVHHHPCR